MAMRHTTWWWLSTLVSTLLVVVLVNQWIQMNKHEFRHPQLVDKKTTDDFLYRKWEKPLAELATVPAHNRRTIKVRTGIFIQSLKFFDSTEVNLSGYIWQRYHSREQADLIPGKGEVGFILPEQVDSASVSEPREVYRHRGADDTVIGWYFEATLRQPFDFSDYPFDHKTAWVRMWHRQFWRNVVLVPDFDSYQQTGTCDIFGIEESIVLGAWDRDDTFFDYTPANYDTDFGIPGYIGQHEFPELRYNFVLKRKFENAFIVYLLPLLLVAMLLFAALLTVSDRDELSSRFGFNTSGFIGACSALFFVVLLAHIQLREQFVASGIVYIEYFYILMYLLLVLATANTFLFSIRPRRGCDWLLYEDNIVVKLAYWPVVLACLIVITLGVNIESEARERALADSTSYGGYQQQLMQQQECPETDPD